MVDEAAAKVNKPILFAWLWQLLLRLVVYFLANRWDLYHARFAGTSGF